ncbi:MAG: hypothetical protein ACRD8Z_02835, partial [Nitrososphaeraceae archaeon]
IVLPILVMYSYVLMLLPFYVFLIHLFFFELCFSIWPFYMIIIIIEHKCISNFIQVADAFVITSTLTIEKYWNYYFHAFWNTLMQTKSIAVIDWAEGYLAPEYSEYNQIS